MGMSGDLCIQISREIWLNVRKKFARVLILHVFPTSPLRPALQVEERDLGHARDARLDGAGRGGQVRAGGPPAAR